MSGRPAVFFDRDGVLDVAVVKNGRPYPPVDAEAMEITPGAAGLLAKLKAAGFALVCVTNQPDFARGTRTRENIEAMNAKAMAALPLDDVFTCLHDNADNCACRKPKPGLLFMAAEKWGLDLAQSWMIGDRAGDVGAGRAAGCRTVFLDFHYAEPGPCPAADFTCSGLAVAVDVITRCKERGMTTIEGLKVKLFADGASKEGMLEMYANPLIKGFTTNPTLMRKAGVTDYAAFAKDMAALIPDRPLSFEVFSDEFGEMERQAQLIRTWGGNVFVKIPVTNSRGESSMPLVRRLAADGVKLNVTALMTLEQVKEVSAALGGEVPCFISLFAGRVADTGVNPSPLMAAAVEAMRPFPNQELIWASPRELFNVFQADQVGCHVITATNDILRKLALVGKDLAQYSLETVQMFKKDADAAGFRL